jgi:hypothetical protein
MKCYSRTPHACFWSSDPLLTSPSKPPSDTEGLPKEKTDSEEAPNLDVV